jgi:hypothetical protein
LERCQAVTKQDVLDSLRTYFLPLFDPSSSVVVSVTAPGKADEICQGLQAAGFEVERRTLEADADGEESGSEDSESGSDGSSDGGL